MRLINVDTMELEEFFDNEIPRYAILSHRWEKGEVTFQDYVQSWDCGQRGDDNGRRSILLQKEAGFKKIAGLCNMARSESIGYVWIDTCCIDKTSSAELSEAINSMFAWYLNSVVCYAYLSDVISETPDEYDRLLRKSKWFTRGWTLQELLAPRMLAFYDKNWNNMGTRNSKHGIIEAITGIREVYLCGERDYLTVAPVAEKFSWASGRKTTRTEDMAYCLLGLLDVNMPLLYGEGHKAFRRLQEEFMRTHLDLTLLTWGFMRPPQVYMGFSNRHSGGIGCLANTVSQFSRWNRELIVRDPEEHHTNTNAGLLLAVTAREIAHLGRFRTGFIPLDNIQSCNHDGFTLAIPIVWSATGGPTKAERADGNGPFWVPSYASRSPTVKGASSMDSRTYLVSPPHIQVVQTANLLQSPTKHRYYIRNDGDFQKPSVVDFRPLVKRGYYLADFYPPNIFGSARLMGPRDPKVSGLFRFTHPERGDMFLLQSNYPSASDDPTLLLGTAPETCTTWEHLLKPDYVGISFRRPRESFFWFSKVRLRDLKHPSRISVHIGKGFYRHGDSYLEKHVSLRVTKLALPVDFSGHSDNSDNSGNSGNSEESDN